MTKKIKTFFEIFLQGIGLYFSNADKFLQYMFYPVFGRVLGGIIIVYSIIFYNQNLDALIVNYPVLNTPLYKNLILFIVLIPGLIVYLSSLWKYLISYASVNSMTENLLKSDRVYDFPAHNELVTRRWFKYLCLWILYGSIMFLTAIPIFWLIGGILLVYFTFVFQIFVFEDQLSPIDCFKKSSIYVQGNFWKLFWLITFIGGLTYCIIPQIIYTFLNLIKVNGFLTSFIAEGIQTSSLYNLNLMLSAVNHPPVNPQNIASIIVAILIYKITIQMLLPLRTICICLWYKNFCNDNDVVKIADQKFMNRVNQEVKRRKKSRYKD